MKQTSITFKLLAIVFIVISGCADTPTSLSDPFNGCPAQIDFPQGVREPDVFTEDLRTSYDNKYLSFINRYSAFPQILNLQTLEVKEINFTKSLPSNVKHLFSYVIDWCPYSDTLVLVGARTLVDTNNSGKLVDYFNYLIVSLNGNIIRQALPQEFLAGKNIPHIRWLARSRPSEDYFYIIEHIRKYSFSEDKLYEYSTQSGIVSSMMYKENYEESRDRKNYFFETRGYQRYSDWFINDTQIENPHFENHWTSWSPDGKRLAISGQDIQDTVSRSMRKGKEIYVYELPSGIQNVSKLRDLKPRVINLRKSFCKFSVFGIFASFISDSTLAVVMHEDGEDFTPIYEITLDGKIVQQLTFRK